MLSFLATTTSIGNIEPVTQARAPENLSEDAVVGSLETYISDIIGVITVLAALFFVVYAFLAAFDWISAGGDSGKVAKARERLMWSTLGLILMVAAYSIIGLIGSLIGINLLEPGQLIKSLVPGQ
jgi:hypothetical protein